LSVAIGPLMAHLLSPGATFSNSTEALQYNSTFNPNAYNSIADLMPYMNIASATVSFNATSPPWMTVEYAFAPFVVSGLPSNGTVTTNATAFAAYLDCNVLGPSEYSIRGTDISLNDRGCNASPSIDSGSFRLYSQVWSERDCGLPDGSTRLGLITGTHSNGSSTVLSNPVVISCKPGYWRASGCITLTLRPGAEPLIVYFQNTTSWDQQHYDFTRFFENGLVQDTLFDASNSFQANIFGRLVYNYASVTNPNNALNSPTLRDGLESIFTATHAAMTSRLLFPQTTPYTNYGILSKPVTKLFVVQNIAIAIMTAMSVILLINIWLAKHAFRDRSFMEEEPIGLLGNAAVICVPGVPSVRGVQEFVAEFRTSHSNVQNVREQVMKHYDLKGSACRYDWSTGRIVVDRLCDEAGATART
jgi:hypothetical protein